MPFTPGLTNKHTSQDKTQDTDSKEEPQHGYPFDPIEPAMKTLHPHQESAIERLRQALRNGYRRPVLQAPTGFGKTVVAAHIVGSALDKNRRVIITVPALSLVDQTVREFHAAGLDDIGVIQADHRMTDYSKSVQVASVQTLQRRGIPKADLVLIDECHRMSALYDKWFSDDEWAHVPFIGMSATPWTRGLGRLYDTLIVAATTRDLIAKGFLAPFRVLAPVGAAPKPDLTGVRTVAGDFHEGDLSKAMQKRELVADIVKTWIEKGEQRPTFCFAVDRAHAQSLVARFKEAGVACDYIDAETPPNEREMVRRRFHNGDIQVVVNIAVLTTGIDWDVRCIVFARPTKSEMLFVQIIGRGLRTAKGKTDLLILDHSDTTARLGFVTDIHHTRLSGGKMALEDITERETKERLPKACKQCGTMMAPQVQKCPACGFERELISDVISRPGELVELNEFRETKVAKKRNDTDDWAAKIDFIAQVRGYAEDYGKTAGWVAWKYKDYYGVWPNDPKVRHAPAKECGMEVRMWIKAMNMRFVKAKAAERKNG